MALAATPFIGAAVAKMGVWSAAWNQKFTGPEPSRLLFYHARGSFHACLCLQSPPLRLFLTLNVALQNNDGKWILPVGPPTERNIRFGFAPEPGPVKYLNRAF